MNNFVCVAQLGPNCDGTGQLLTAQILILLSQKAKKMNLPINPRTPYFVELLT